MSVGSLKVIINFTEFPPAHTCDGADMSPQITIDGLDATSVAVMVFNPSMHGTGSYCAWLIWDMPAVNIIPAGIPHGKIIKEPVSALQGMNDAGEVGYTGPCPLPGQLHRYLFRVYGLDDFLHISAGSTKNELLAGIHGHVIQYGETEAVAARKVA